MRIFGKKTKEKKVAVENTAPVMDENIVEEAEESPKITPLQLFQNDVVILEKIEALQQKIEGMDKNNKKFLMAATMNDGRAEKLEKDIVDMKLGAISLLDQIDILLSVILTSEAEDLKTGLDSYYSGVTGIVSGLGLEEIHITENMKFDSKAMECAEIVHREGYEDDTVVALLQRGYKDKKSGNILRYAKVSVNKCEGEE